MATMRSGISAGTVCIVDDDMQVRRFLGEILSSLGLAAEEYSSGEDFMRRWHPHGPTCVLLDVRMPRMTGPEIHDWLRAHHPGVPVIFLSGFADVTTAVRAMRLGAFDFLEKPFNVQQLIERIHEALRHAAAHDDGEHGHRENSAWQDQLTPRERQVLAGIVTGKRNKAIASELGISERTVETHRASISNKAGTHSVAELVARVLGSAPH